MSYKEVNVFALEQEIFGVPAPNFEKAKQVSKTAKKWGIDVHQSELELGMVKCDPRTFEDRHPEVAQRAKEAAKPMTKVKAAMKKTEIDSIPDVFGALYRVWEGEKLLGTFYESLDGHWVAQPLNCPSLRPKLRTSDQAHLVVVASWMQG